MFAHAVGYVNNGKSGIESQANFRLLRSHSFFLVQIMNDIRDEKNQGDTVVSTLDYRIQKAAYDALGNQDGAVVVLEPSTGKILAMVSKPDFDPNTLEDKGFHRIRRGQFRAFKPSHSGTLSARIHF